MTISPLLQICKNIRAHVAQEIKKNSGIDVIVVLSAPAETASAASAGESRHRLNLFFHRFEPSGLFPDALPGETGWLRAFCLITPFAAQENNIGSGENDLWLIGEVVRIFQEQPVFTIDIDKKSYCLQAIFLSLGLDQLNQLWSTQGDAIYRPSVLYEISLIPVEPLDPAKASPLVGSLGLEVQPTLESRHAANVSEQRPLMAIMHPNTKNETWAPAIAFVFDGTCTESLLFNVQDSIRIKVWVAGKPNESVNLCWEVWNAKDGWQKAANHESNATIKDNAIDPYAISKANTVELDLPEPKSLGQRLLYAQRTFNRQIDGVADSVRSNPLLISLIEKKAP